MIFLLTFCMEKSFELSNTSVCGRGCPREEESELQLLETEEVKVTTVNIKPHPWRYSKPKVPQRAQLLERHQI